MKKKGAKILVLGLSAAFLLCGCGGAVHEMTKEEEDLVVQYSAHVLSKYNIYQKDGMTSAWPEEETEVETESETEDTQEPETEEPDNNTVMGETGQLDSDDRAPTETVSLSDAFGHEGISVTYGGYSLEDYYLEGDYYSVGADNGGKLMIMKFTLANTSQEKISVNALADGSSYKVAWDDTGYIPEKLTFISDGLSCYAGDIESGKTAEVVLIFQLSAEQAKTVSEPKLFVEKGEVLNSIEL